MTKKIIEIAIQNKSLNHVIFIFLLLWAYMSYEKIPKEMFPPSSLDMLSIQGYYSGANSDALDKLIVRDIEDIVRDNQYVKDINTVISNGRFHINAEIDEPKRMQECIDDIKNALQDLRRDLPQDMDMPVVKASRNYFMLLNISVSSNTKKEYIEAAKKLQEDIKKLPNLHSIELEGDYDPIMVISIDEQKLLAYGISKEKAYKSLMGLYSLYPIGSVSSDTQKYHIQSKNNDTNLDAILDSNILADDKIISVRDIAQIRYDYQSDDVVTKTNARQSVVINIKKTKDGDAIELSKQIRRIVSEHKSRYEDIGFEVLSDSSFWIKNRLNTITSNIIIGLILLFVSIWLFISLKIAIVVILGIPVSFAFGLIGLDLFDASINTLSMIGVLLSLGILADEAIVVSENIHRHLNKGKELTQACTDAAHEMMPILFASMLTTVAAFLPLTMLSGNLGIFIKIIPLIVIILIVSSFIESILFLPLHYKELSLGFIKEKKPDYRELMWSKISYIYRSSLSFLIKKRYLWGLFIVGFTVVGILILIRSSSFQLFAEFDAMTVNITAKTKNNSIAYTLQESKKLESVLLNNLNQKDISSISTIVGMNSDGRSLHERGDNLFTLSINLREKVHDDFFNAVVNPIFMPYKDKSNSNATRERYAKEIKEEVESLITTNGLKDELLEFDINIPQTGVVKNDVEIAVSHEENEKIEQGIKRLKEKMGDIEGVVQIKDDMNMDDLKAQVKINAHGVALGFTQDILTSKARKFVSPQKISKIVDTNSNLIELKVDFKGCENMDSLYNLSLDIPSKEGSVSLKEIADISFIKDATTVKKDNQNKIFTVSANFDKKKMSSRKFYKLLNPLIEELRSSGIRIYIKGEEKTNEQIKRDIALSLVFALFTILIVLIWLFESFWLSLFALSVIPLSLFGVLVGHKIMGMNISFSSVLGFVGLIGIVINDTLIMLKMIKESKNTNELIENALMRVRPILLTSITTFIGLFTLIFFASGESLLMQPLAVSMGFGLIYATVINLYYLPLAYSFTKIDISDTRL